ncbi:hypothetical protein [Clostridium sp.]|uniref:hypothetical protein n=1 Tax=Clostridium sp. TaxID=1506 RepID=UPI0029155D87|nr:hypothetical protein [Clostridium sp.]MDU5107146.1 hypothetical protein [Clostridium sp.]
MTVEVGILNKHGIALASDSAVTIGNGIGYYNSANKLFELTKGNPVGIMIYNNSFFMGCPVEIIVKEYRKRIGIKKFDTLREYWNDFMNFLKEFVIEYNINVKEYLLYVMCDYLEDMDTLIKNTIDDFIKEIEENDDINFNNSNEYEIMINSRIEKAISEFREFIEGFPDDDEFMSIKERIIDEINEDLLEKLDLIIEFKLEESVKEIIINTCYGLITKKIYNPASTGFVVAGYGDKEIYPQIIAAEISGCYFGNLKTGKIVEEEIDDRNMAAIIPFAQDDVIKTFMNGMDYSFMDKINKVIMNNESICKLDIDESCRKSILNDIDKEFGKFSYNKHWGPMINTVASSPKEELSLMAETLVNLTSFRRKMNMDEMSQTVGGPIDVAIISKGDGFIWIKRKQYFDKDINYRYLQRT